MKRTTNDSNFCFLRKFWGQTRQKALVPAAAGTNRPSRVYYQHGPIEPHPSTPSLNNIALTWFNLTRAASRLLFGILGILAARYWWKQQWRKALLYTAGCMIASAVSAQLDSLASEV